MESFTDKYLTPDGSPAKYPALQQNISGCRERRDRLQGRREFCFVAREPGSIKRSVLSKSFLSTVLVRRAGILSLHRPLINFRNVFYSFDGVFYTGWLSRHISERCLKHVYTTLLYR